MPDVKPRGKPPSKLRVKAIDSIRMIPIDLKALKPSSNPIFSRRPTSARFSLLNSLPRYVHSASISRCLESFQWLYYKDLVLFSLGDGLSETLLGDNGTLSDLKNKRVSDKFTITVQHISPLPKLSTSNDL